MRSPRTPRSSCVTMLAGSFVLLAGLASPAHAQTSATASIGGSVESLDTTDSSRAATVAADVEHSIGRRIVLFYGLGAGTYAWPGEWGFAMHRAGVTFQNRADAKDGTRAAVGVDGTWRFNGSSWSAANYRAAAAFADLETRAGPSVFRTWYRFDARAFDGLPELDQQEQTVAGSALHSIQRTRTTVVGEVTAGRKAYAGTTTGTVAQQVTWLARVAQNVSERTGASLQVASRHIAGTVPPVLVVTPGMFFEDGVYDDPYANSARSWRASVTRIVGTAGSLSGSVADARKNYEAFGRVDTVTLAAVTWQVPVRTGQSGPIDYTISPRYGYTRSRSTDAVYNYTSHAIGVGVTFAY